MSKDERSITTEKELQMLYAAATLKQLVAVQWVRELLRKSSKLQEKDHVSRTLLVRMDDQLSMMMEHFAASQRVAFTPMPFPCEWGGMGWVGVGWDGGNVLPSRATLELTDRNRRPGCQVCRFPLHNDVAFCVCRVAGRGHASSGFCCESGAGRNEGGKEERTATHPPPPPPSSSLPRTPTPTL